MTWIERLKVAAENRWVPWWKREMVFKIVGTLTEEEAKALCIELETEIRRSIEEWRLYQ